MKKDKKYYELYTGKTLSNIFEDIYRNSKSTSDRVFSLIDDLKKFSTSLDNAILIVPLIKEYLDVKVKSDEHLVKLSDIVQRSLKDDGRSEGDNALITEADKKKLLEDVPSYNDFRKKEDIKVEQLNQQVEKIKNELNIPKSKASN